ncbi:hypothetical protein [Hymenobacter glacieicola]|uniref:Uncharacterized protein n=1 Tax=Hymenobacter glacieicola TaxID=1562124 RepID=A0ABQ1WNH4_9BACT|nr:hypothetical protein [Hymenobacter glacieicola]GGG33909.1 hypothetical protein GCM10011378_07940 [Hymenobacter glacieicola]
MRLASALDPAQQVSVPCTYSQTDAALTYWLSNPLLPAGRVEATRERLPFLGIAEKQALVHRLKEQVRASRMNQPLDGPGYNRLLTLIRDKRVSRDERVGLKPHLVRLRGAEIDWEYTRLEKAITLQQSAHYDKEAA